jgi:hypothetical protein
VVLDLGYFLLVRIDAMIARTSSGGISAGLGDWLRSAKAFLLRRIVVR